MPKFSIFSHTENKHSNNSAVLHRTDVVGNGSAVINKQRELVRDGHTITGCLEQKDDRNGSPRRGRR